mgnify:FL=1
MTKKKTVKKIVKKHAIKRIKRVVKRHRIKKIKRVVKVIKRSSREIVLTKPMTKALVVYSPHHEYQ